MGEMPLVSDQYGGASLDDIETDSVMFVVTRCRKLFVLLLLSSQRHLCL